ncbi:MAG: hypothetical protein L0Z50_06260 [Verrucomicrobiales bacterium]|nr:hypothetical protein [Verrucomicrobiales bacterium]
MDKSTEITEPSPNLKPVPDALFGDSESIDDGCDVVSRLLMALAKDMTFFNLPLLEQLHRRPYHLVKLRGEFATAKLLRDHQSQLLRSESCQTPNHRKQIERLMFCLGQGVFAVYDTTELMVYAPTREAAAEAAAQMKSVSASSRVSGSSVCQTAIPVPS